MLKFIAAVLPFALFPAAALAQEVPELLQRYGDAEAHVLFEVKAAAVQSQGLAVLSEPDPAVHLFEPNAYRAWGRTGGGPAELESPADIAWPADALVVLDVGHRKLVSFDDRGGFLGSRSLGDVWANRLFVAGSDTILAGFVPMTGERAVIRIRGGERDTLYSYATSSSQIRLEAPGAPSLTLSEPFTAQTEWTILPQGNLAVWTPNASQIDLYDLDGRRIGAVDGIGDRRPVAVSDQEFWLDDAIPDEFMGRQGIFDPLRRRARDVVEFPDRFPAVLAIEGDPAGGVWIRQTTAGSGEVWLLKAIDGADLGSVRLPPGRQLLRVGDRGLIAWTTDELGVERIEVYARPSWALPR